MISGLVVKSQLEIDEKAYWNKDVSRLLGIADSTVRKWCLALERNGYTFIRGHKESRAFLKHDINALKHFQDLTKVGSFTIEQAAKIVVEQYSDRRDSDITASVPSTNERSESVAETYLKKLVELQQEQVEINKEQIDINKELLKRLSERDKLIEEQLSYIARLNEQAATVEQERTQHMIDTAEEKEVKKKGLTERIISLFKN